MNADLTLLQKRLAENKVYDAWQYVQSLMETLTFMNMSYALLEKVYERRKDKLKSAANELSDIADKHTGESVPIPDDILYATNLVIAGLEIDDSIFLRKTALEFFHYARLSIEVLSQIINAALFGDDADGVEEGGLPKKVSHRLGQTLNFAKLRKILTKGISDDQIKYLFAFDNYIKHIKTIFITTKNSFLIGTNNEFYIGDFINKKSHFQKVETMSKTKEVKNVVMKLLDDALTELINQIPNCTNNANRFQTLHYIQIFQKTDTGSAFRYTSFFIEVENSLNELPQLIKVMPLRIKTNNAIYSSILNIDKIFITLKGKGESGVIGIATLQNNSHSNDLYKTYIVSQCTMPKYLQYTESYLQTHKNMPLNYPSFQSMEGSTVIIKNETKK